MRQRFVDYVTRQRLFAPGEEVLLAVSGGRDSMALCHLMLATGFPFAMAHCNFGLREGDSERDERFVRQFASQRGIPLFVRRFSTRQDAALHGTGIEEEARRQRYDFFYELMDQHGFRCVATAHHMDDSIETFFLNLLRGTGIAGLHGILPRSAGPRADMGEGSVVRPMLCFTRADIDAYVQEQHIDYVEDYTNHQTLFRRNQLRHQLIPMLRAIEPRFEEVMADNLQHLHEAEQLYRQAVEERRARCLHVEADGTAFLMLRDVLSLSPCRTLLYEMLRPYGFGIGVVDDVLRHAQDRSGQVYFSATHRLSHDRDRLSLSPIGNSRQQRPPRLLSTEEGIGEGGFERKAWRCAPCEAMFDADTLRQPLHMRHWRQGDRFRPFGMAGSQLVSDYFSDHKFTLPQREACWLLVDAEGEIAWIVGHRAAAVAPVTATTRRVLRLRLPQGGAE